MLDAAADRHLRLAGHHLRGGHVARLEARCAEAVDLHAGRGFRVAGREHRDAADARALLADGLDAAEHDVVDGARVETVAVANRAQRGCGERERRDAVQAAVLLALPRGVRTASKM